MYLNLINMKKDPTNGELAIILENVCKELKEGFSGVYERQDKTNGNVKKNTEFRIANAPELKRLLKLVYGTIGFVLMAVGGAILQQIS